MKASTRTEKNKLEIRSGSKYRTSHGFTAIKDGVSRNTASKLIPSVEVDATTRKPPWLRVRLPHGPKFTKTQQTVQEHKLHTVCAESHCPNIGECWSNGTATLMLMGSVCTRACKFCAVDTGNPHGWLDPKEPVHCAEAVWLMRLKYVVLTSVDRDDLKDGGAAHYVACIEAIRERNSTTIIEALTPDFSGNRDAVEIVANSAISVFAQNLETVRSLTSTVRDPRAGYDQTLEVLRYAKDSSGVNTKSSLMLGLGESKDELYQAFDDLLEAGVDFLTLGQYLRPTPNHLPVRQWISPEQFAEFQEIATKSGFSDVASGPLVRSSYRADKLAGLLTS